MSLWQGVMNKITFALDTVNDSSLKHPLEGRKCIQKQNIQTGIYSLFLRNVELAKESNITHTHTLNS